MINAVALIGGVYGFLQLAWTIVAAVKIFIVRWRAEFRKG